MLNYQRVATEHDPLMVQLLKMMMFHEQNLTEMAIIYFPIWGMHTWQLAWLNLVLERFTRRGLLVFFYCNSSGRQPFFGMHHAAHTSFVMRFTGFSLPWLQFDGVQSVPQWFHPWKLRTAVDGSFHLPACWVSSTSSWLRTSCLLLNIMEFHGIPGMVT